MLLSGEFIKVLNYSSEELERFYQEALSIVPPPARTAGRRYLETQKQYWESIRARDEYLMDLIETERATGKNIGVIRGFGHVHTIEALDNAMIGNGEIETVGGINLRSDQANIIIESSENGFQIPSPDKLGPDFTIDALAPNITQILSITPPAPVLAR